MVHTEEPKNTVEPETAVEKALRALCTILYTDDACVAFHTAQGVKRLIAIVVEVWTAFESTVWKEYRDDVYAGNCRGPSSQLQAKANYMKIASFVNLGGTVTECPDIAVEISRCAR